MDEIDATDMPGAGGLLARMMALARLSEGVGPVGASRTLVDGLLRQRLLFSRMAERLRIAPPDSPLMHAVMREAELGCLECAAWRHCRGWLDNGSPYEDYREFCPNEGFFAVLPRVEKAKQPHSAE